MKHRWARPTLILVTILSLIFTVQGTASVQAAITAASFALRGPFPLGIQSHDFAVADLDGDGIADLITSNYVYNQPSSLTVLRGASTGANSIAFKAPLVFPTLGEPNYVAAADFDGDGRSDVVTLKSTPGTVVVKRNTTTNGEISFAEDALFPIDLYLGGAFASIIDMNVDGKLDIVMARQGTAAFFVFLNTSPGEGFIAFDLKSFPMTENYHSFAAIGDVDGDNLLDFAAVQNPMDYVSIYRNTSVAGNLSFASAPDAIKVGYGARPYLADMDGDGKLDLVNLMVELQMGFPDQSTKVFVRILRNTSTGPGSAAFASATDTLPFTYQGIENLSMEISDLDADAKPDLVLLPMYANDVRVMGNTNSGPMGFTFAAPQFFTISGFIHLKVTAADLDGDAMPELVVLNQNSDDVVVLRNMLDPAPVCQPVSLSASRNTAKLAAPQCTNSGPTVPLTYQIATNGAHGTAAITADGKLEYVPQKGYVGADTFTYTAFDGNSYSVPVTVNVTVSNTAPLAAEDDYTVRWMQTLTVDAARGLLTNDDDANEDTLTAYLVRAPAHGQLTFQADGSFTYTPAPTFRGEDSFTYYVSDGVDRSGEATVTIAVEPFRTFLPALTSSR